MTSSRSSFIIPAMEVELATAPNRYSPSSVSPISGDADLIGAQRIQIPEAFQQIAEVAQSIFHILRGGVGCPGEGSEGGYIYENTLTEAADVKLTALTTDDGLRRLNGI